MRLCLRTILVLTSLPALGCAVSLKAPLPAADPTLDLHAPYLGTWSVTQLAGQVPDEPIEIRVELDDAQNLIARLTTGSRPQSQVFHLTLIEGLVLAFAEDELAGGWDVAQLLLDGTGQILTVRSLDVSRIRQDIAAGNLPGRIQEVDTKSDVLNIEASSDELAAYITADPTVFVNAAVFSKVQ